MPGRHPLRTTPCCSRKPTLLYTVCWYIVVVSPSPPLYLSIVAITISPLGSQHRLLYGTSSQPSLAQHITAPHKYDDRTANETVQDYLLSPLPPENLNRGSCAGQFRTNAASMPRGNFFLLAPEAHPKHNLDS
ncbi:hypothetical protein HYFRA_00004529 [Hymenoscyphus fraxineus]|uniref:Uncharacterized protein n=1 Tax=Hymenoscyphus fraxineus TaxID=746836 RepID=A0A9N9KUQ2_9HELO|nr:hypothetical protein HYFRA_00004529 [Hymenoscyphus fraxineus]